MSRKIRICSVCFLLVVGLIVGAIALQSAPAAQRQKMNLNTATRAQLEALPGVGPELAENIISSRPFRSVDDLKNIQGIGEGRFDEIKNLVIVGEEEAVSPKLGPGQTININSATQDELERLLGIGPVRARAIIEARPFSKIEDIMKVKGIKEKTFGKIRGYIVVR